MKAHRVRQLVLPHPAPSEETADDLRFVYETNVFAVVRMTNAFLDDVQLAW